MSWSIKRTHMPPSNLFLDITFHLDVIWTCLIVSILFSVWFNPDLCPFNSIWPCPELLCLIPPRLVVGTNPSIFGAPSPINESSRPQCWASTVTLGNQPTFRLSASPFCLSDSSFRLQGSLFGDFNPSNPMQLSSPGTETSEQERKRKWKFHAWRKVDTSLSSIALYVFWYITPYFPHIYSQAIEKRTPWQPTCIIVNQRKTNEKRGKNENPTKHTNPIQTLQISTL